MPMPGFLHKIFPVGPLQCNCSLIADTATREAMVVDPGDNIPEILVLLARHHLKLKHIVVTHAHIDHVGGAMQLKAATGAPILLNQKDATLLKMIDIQAAWIGVRSPGPITIDQSIADADTLATGAHSATVIHTPGHTQGSLCLYFPQQQKLIAGDTLFAGSIGRTDLPGGNHKQLIDSIHSRLFALPDSTVVVPGHGPLTTIAEERASNPFLQSR